MNNTKAVDVNNIKVGDFVKVKGCAGNWDEAHWGRSLAPWDGKYIYTEMEDRSLMRAEAHWCAVENKSCYKAKEGEVVGHIPKDKVAMHEGKPVNIEDHGQPAVFAAVVSQLHETVSYLEQMTGKKFEPKIHSFGLSAEGTYTDNNVTIRFVEKGK